MQCKASQEQRKKSRPKVDRDRSVWAMRVRGPTDDNEEAKGQVSEVKCICTTHTCRWRAGDVSIPGLFYLPYIHLILKQLEALQVTWSKYPLTALSLMLILPHLGWNQTWIRQNCSLTEFPIILDNVSLSRIFQTWKMNPEMKLWVHFQFITVFHHVHSVGSSHFGCHSIVTVHLGHSFSTLPSLLCVFSHFLPLTLHCHYKKDHIISCLKVTRFPTLWQIKSIIKSHTLGHN